MEREKYCYKNLPIPGGGYVTGILFHEKEENIQYLRTDIGGAYRLNRSASSETEVRWESLINHVTMEDLRETYPIALAMDPKNPDMLYIVSGQWGRADAKLSISKDRGNTFIGVNLPFRAHGNLNGRGTGRKLIVDRQDSKKLYFASQQDGLWISKNGGLDWTKAEGMPEQYLTFVGQSMDGRYLIVGTAGVSCATAANTIPAAGEQKDAKANTISVADEKNMQKEMIRGAALYISEDGGISFTPMWQPKNVYFPDVLLPGYVAQRYAWDKDYLYVTFSVMGPNAKNREMGYSCDNGSLMGGKLIRYPIGWLHNSKGEDISPDASRLMLQTGSQGDNPMDSGGTFGRKDQIIQERQLDMLPYGLVGIDAAGQTPGLIVVSGVSKEDGDCLFRSLDYGNTWEVILYDLLIGKMDFRTEYMKPQYNGGHNLIHWMTDVSINPFDSTEMWFNTGTGPFVTHNLLDEEVHFSDYADGIEETVHLNLYSPTKGEVKLIDIVGDLGGFAFADLNKPCDNSFADAEGNRYITCINADVSDAEPQTVVVTPRGNWTGMTKGGLILSKDQCRNFERLPMPFGISEKTDRLLHRIEKPNVNSGWVAMSADCKHIVWTIGDIIYLPADCVVVSHDGGKSFEKANIYDLKGTCISDFEVPDAKEIIPCMGLWRGAGQKEMPKYAYALKVYSDRVDASLFYGFGMKGEFYISEDGGSNFYQRRVQIRESKMQATGILSDTIRDVNFSLIDTINKTEIRGEGGKSGIFYMALADEGLWKLVYHRSEQMASDKHISSNEQTHSQQRTSLNEQMHADKQIPPGDTNCQDYVDLLRLTKEGDRCYRMGLGVGRPGGDYLSEDKAIYMAAVLDGQYGFYRSTDDCDSYVRINKANQMFGEINSIEGDSQEYGRFYVATGSRGVLYGEPQREHFT